MIALSFIAGMFFGTLFIWYSYKNDINIIDLEKENLKLRKENEVLWNRLNCIKPY